MTAVRAVGVVVPARDEQDLVVECLRSVRRSLAALPPSVDTAVTVVLDRCTDATPELVVGELAGWPGAVPVRVAALGGRRAGSGSARGRPTSSPATASARSATWVSGSP
jgi:hypothetical protein